MNGDEEDKLLKSGGSQVSKCLRIKSQRGEFGRDRRAEMSMLWQDVRTHRSQKR
jgi:hypothetical protein